MREYANENMWGQAVGTKCGFRCVTCLIPLCGALERLVILLSNFQSVQECDATDDAQYYYR